MGKTFVGIGFGPIQCGLFLFEAMASKNFERLVVAEVVPELVASVRKQGGRIRVNVAYKHGIETSELVGLEIFNPLEATDAVRLVDAIADADEIATALPSVDFYCHGQPSTAGLLARGMERKLADHRLPRAIVYTAENHNHAAELLREAISLAIGTTNRGRFDERVAFLNTVIGKMSGIVRDPAQIARDGLAPIVEDSDHAVLVEQFNSILISQIPLADFQRNIAVFQEKPDLLPFEEAKLYGHNAAHALFGFLADRARLTFIHEADATLRTFVRDAFIEESGGPLCHRYAGVDPIFTHDGWIKYVDDLLERMVNPYLQDRVDRVIRDPRRKLAWNDRLIGTMRRAIESGVEPHRFATGAAAASEILLREQPAETITSLLAKHWRNDGAIDEERDAIIKLIQQARHRQKSLPSL